MISKYQCKARERMILAVTLLQDPITSIDFCKTCGVLNTYFSEYISRLRRKGIIVICDNEKMYRLGMTLDESLPLIYTRIKSKNPNERPISAPQERFGGDWIILCRKNEYQAGMELINEVGMEKYIDIRCGIA
jgi:hypothetical protein